MTTEPPTFNVAATKADRLREALFDEDLETAREAHESIGAFLERFEEVDDAD